MLPHVVNFEMPNVPEDYVHRIGRTGRAGAQGEAISLVCLDEEGFLRDIEKLIKRSIPRETVPGFEPPSSEKAEPIVLGRMTIGVGGTQRNGRGGGGGGRPGAGRPSGRPGGGGGGGARQGEPRRAGGGGGGQGGGGRPSGGRPSGGTGGPSRGGPSGPRR
jgi:ATP-dependent RNA helicase RhlE